MTVRMVVVVGTAARASCLAISHEMASTVRCLSCCTPLSQRWFGCTLISALFVSSWPCPPALPAPPAMPAMPAPLA
eukprot:5346843-Pleurochrysis_carterae.AAC.2